MSDETPRHSLEYLRKEAKRWLAAIRARDSEESAAARARLERAVGDIDANPALRDVQHALARENGFAGWTALKESIAASDAVRAEKRAAAMTFYETAAKALLDAFRTGTPEAMEAHYRHTWHRRAWRGMRSYVLADLGRPVDNGASDITPDDARYLVAGEYGFASWNELFMHTRAAAGPSQAAAKPVFVATRKSGGTGDIVLQTRDWDAVLRTLREQPDTMLHAAGQMTDSVLADVARIETITALHLGGSQRLTDEGLQHLARLPNLRRLDVSNTAITDRGMAVLRELPALQRLSLAGTRVTDAGAAHLAHCDALQHLNLGGTGTGDGAVRALAGKRRLSHLSTGYRLTDAGVALLHELPVFKTWHGGEPSMALLSYEAEPNLLALRGNITDRGIGSLRGLDGLFGLNIDDSALPITAASLPALVALPNLGWLALDAKDDWMPHIAAMPKLRFLGAQDTSAADDGFVALSASQSVEYIWGRRCHNLRSRGFQALSRMPSLHGLSVSCLNVGDAAIAALPSFPALRELMPMDIPDEGYRHIGKCEALESLVLMYCRNTTDAATEHITPLSRLSYYFNSYTTITDRTPELLSTMHSLERITFDTCHWLTNDGVSRLARLPRLREVSVSGRGVTPAAAFAFGAGVSVRIGE